MKQKTGRRSFLKNVSIAGVAGTLIPTEIISASGKKTGSSTCNNLKDAAGRKYNDVYTGDYLNRVAFPLGGMGAGMFCIEGTGSISHMSIRNKPDIFNTPEVFAAISVKGLKNGAKLLEGPVPDWKKFGQRDAGNGSGGATTGLPHFHRRG